MASRRACMMLRGSVRGSVTGVRGLGPGISSRSRKANERQLSTLGQRPFCSGYRENQCRTVRKLCVSSAELQDASAGTPFILADIGEGITEVEIIRWFVSEGDHVTQFQKLVEVQSDKANVDITSRYDGKILKLGYAEGDIAIVGTPLCFLETADAPASAPPETELVPHSGDDVEIVEEPKKRRVLASPPVRLLAKEHNIDLSTLSGRGPEGRIEKEDVLEVLEERSESTPGTEDFQKYPSPGKYKASLQQRELDEAHETTVPIRGLQRAMVKTMTAAVAVPHLNLGEEICFDQLVGIKNSVSKWAMDKHSLKITFLPFLIKATSLALSSFPVLNSRVDEGCKNVIYQNQHNISIAMDTPKGLVVPNIKLVQELSVLDIARELNRLSETTKAGRFREEDLAGGTFALSNVGSIAGTYTSPVIMLPQVAIGAIGRIQKLPRFDEDGRVVEKRIAHVTWAADHRIIDGATIANFSNLWKRHVENPAEMILEMK
ncbi:hypothetical protein NDN08_000828 [Rhodosorus marinus]|uniref:Dihydrolipoamide acetyltransferase component of pyruvate dehydrogenase complex n=1 Tax=Rhodosorus marinus TaxID=101924 RepID=A0AAV8USP5_9RHOD|nr:hypothetical protein NDN08_000828 [Rhodosorus marinus]